METRKSRFDTPLTRAAIAGAMILLVLSQIYGWASTARNLTPYARLMVLPTRQVFPGVSFQEVHLPGGYDERTLWIYRPQKPVYSHPPCIFVGPNGGTGITGRYLYFPQHAQFVRYAQAG